MWWLDDNLYRGNSGDRRRMLFRTSLSVPQDKPPVSAPYGSIEFELTESQKAANKALLEPEADHESQLNRLLADISSLEVAVREQAAKRTELETKFEQQLALHTQELTGAINNSQLTLETQKSEHDHESQQLRKRLAAAEELVAERDALVTVGIGDANRLRNLLAAAETTIVSRDSELSELQLRLDACEQQHAARLTEAAHEHAAESKHLRAIASLAESRAIERKGLVATLESELASLKETHSAELDQLRDSLEIKRQDTNASLSEASGHIKNQAAEIAELKKHAEWLQEAKEAQRIQLEAASHAKDSARHDLDQRAKQHSIDLLDLNSQIDQLQIDLDRALTEKSSLDAAAKQNESELSTAIADLKQQLTAATVHSHRCNETVRELRQHSVTLQTAIDGLTQSGVEGESKHESETAKLRETIERTQDVAIDQARRAKQIECVLREQNHKLGKSVERLTSEAAEHRTQHQRKISNLQRTIKEHRKEIELLAAEAEQTTTELDRKEGALQRVRSKNERILEIHDSQFTTLQSRVDDLVVALDVETGKRRTAEAEARRLGATRSQRLAFLGQQREQLLTQASQLRSENKRLRAEEGRLRTVAETTKRSLGEATKGLLVQAREMRQLRDQLDATTKAESEKLQQRLDKHAASTREVVRLQALLDQAKIELQACRAQLAEQPSNEGLEDLEFAIVQRDRTIALLEQEAFVMQERLQREAAARRKAEGVIKRKAKTENLDTAVHTAWSHIDAREQVSRLKRQITALENVGLLDRQRAAAEISRLKKRIERLRQQAGNRAA